MSDTSEGKERRKEDRGVSSEIHDLVIRIDANLTNHMRRVDDHIKDDTEKFSEIEKEFQIVLHKIGILSMYVFIGIGIFITIEFFLNFIK